MSNALSFAGVDVSKKSLDVCVLREDGVVLTAFKSLNSAAGRRELLARLSKFRIDRITLEPTGGYEQPLIEDLSAAQQPVFFVNAARIRHLAKASGQRAKTDKLDARIIADFGVRYRNESLRPLPTPAERELADLATRREQLIEARTAEINRSKGRSKFDSIRKEIDSHITILNKRVETLDERIKALIEANPDWRASFEILDSIPGIGTGVACALIAGIPELRHLNRRQAAALAGVAPYTHESGDHKGKSFCSGGRASVRCALYMAVMAATHPRCRRNLFHDLYERLLARGKPKRVAQTACMRKMLTIACAMLKTGQKWGENRAPVNPAAVAQA